MSTRTKSQNLVITYRCSGVELFLCAMKRPIESTDRGVSTLHTVLEKVREHAERDQKIQKDRSLKGYGKRGGDEFVRLEVGIATRQMLRVLQNIIGSRVRSTNGFKVCDAITKYCRAI